MSREAFSFSFCLMLTHSIFLPETGGEVPSEPQGADSFRVPRLGGAGVQPAPARARDHAPLQTPPADLLALVTHQEDDHRVLLLIPPPPPPAFYSIHLPASLLISDNFEASLAAAELQPLITTDDLLLPSAKGTRF